MKIGIITFNSAHNYGAVLQAWALQEKLLEEGHEVDIINYRLPAIDKLYKILKKPSSPFKRKKLNELVHRMQYMQLKIKSPALSKKYHKFENFINYTLHTTQAYRSYRELVAGNLEYDAMIAGSDQIWNGAITQGVNPAYFLYFGNEKAKRITYAASIGRDEIPEVERTFFARYLKNIDYISVREEKAKEQIVPLINKEVSVVLDPTLILAKEKYDQLKKDPKVNKEYIYVHNVHIRKVDERLNNMAEEVSKRLGLPIVHNRADYTFTNELHKFIDGGPDEFIGWIANAKFVIANSFHATVFSIIYHRNFITIPHFQNPERMRHLLDSLGIGNHLIAEVEELPSDFNALDIDYNQVEILREEQKKASLEFLHHALDGEKTTKQAVKREELFFDSKDIYSCYGCAACKDACPVDAITMEVDQEGFWYPFIDEEKCIHCDLCRKVCIYKRRNRKKEDTQIYPKVYASYAKEETIHRISTSGGMFTPMYQDILQLGGKVVGVKYTEDMEVVYDIAEDEQGCQAFRGSKYVAANSYDVKPRVKKLLDEGTIVLFTGNPCQIAGLKSYLKKDYENLYTVEIICHGVPSPKVFRLYLDYLEERYNSKVVDFEFRNKVRGWSKAYVCIHFESGEVMLETAARNNFNRAFLSNHIQRPACYTCEFASLKRGIGDITIGDYWGIQEQHPDYLDERGVSIIKINNEKGEAFFERFKDQLDLLESTYDQAYKANHKKPMTLLTKRNKLMSQIDDVEINKLLLSYNHLKKKKKKVKKK